MPKVDQMLTQEFKCARCGYRGANVERLAISGTGMSRWLALQGRRFAFVSCRHCGYTEVYNLQILEGNENLGSLFEMLFAD